MYTRVVSNLVLLLARYCSGRDNRTSVCQAGWEPGTAAYVSLLEWMPRMHI